MIAKFLPFRHCPFRHVDFGQKRHYYIFMVFHYYGLSIFFVFWISCARGMTPVRMESLHKHLVQINLRCGVVHVKIPAAGQTFHPVLDAAGSL